MSVVDMEAIARSKIRLGAHPLGGSNREVWAPIVARYGIDLTVVDATLDKTFAFMPLDHDGKIRMDCSSPYAMAGLVALKDRYDLAFGKRRRQRSPRHRHAVGRSHEPESLSHA